MQSFGLSQHGDGVSLKRVLEGSRLSFASGLVWPRRGSGEVCFWLLILVSIVIQGRRACSSVSKNI